MAEVLYRRQILNDSMIFACTNYPFLGKKKQKSMCVYIIFKKTCNLFPNSHHRQGKAVLHINLTSVLSHWTMLLKEEYHSLLYRQNKINSPKVPGSYVSSLF